MERSVEVAVQVTRVLVPIDFSPSARAALDYAAFLADRLGAELEVLHVWEPPGYAGPDTLALLPAGPGPPGWDQARGEVRREVEHFVGEGSARPRQVRVRVEAGEPSDTILQVAEAGGTDLIVMGTHGRTGLSRLLVGSVAEDVMRRAACPVLTLRVPSSASRERASPAAGSASARGGAP
jgi:nucleotide-binding universal stress UspA family protein